MGRLSAKLRSIGGGDRHGIMHWCPGCDSPHAIWTSGPSPVWTYNGNPEAPTCNPSILVYTTEEDGKRTMLCHYFIRKGSDIPRPDLNLDPNKSYIDFCGDSPHKFSGQLVELPDWPYAEGEYGGA